VSEQVFLREREVRRAAAWITREIQAPTIDLNPCYSRLHSHNLSARLKRESYLNINHGPKRWRYSVEVMKALTISAPVKSPLNLFSLSSQKL
jgi:hypothetical protein